MIGPGSDKNHTLVFWRRFGESFKLWTQPLLSPTITIGSLVLYKLEHLSVFFLSVLFVASWCYVRLLSVFVLLFLFVASWCYVQLSLNITTMRFFLIFCLFLWLILVLCKHYDNVSFQFLFLQLLLKYHFSYFICKY